jgi:hypothetical protein
MQNKNDLKLPKSKIIGRWDQLYSLNKFLIHKKENMKKQINNKKQEDEMNPCTFNPFHNKVIKKEYN